MPTGLALADGSSTTLPSTTSTTLPAGAQSVPAEDFSITKKQHSTMQDQGQEGGLLERLGQVGRQQVQEPFLVRFGQAALQRGRRRGPADDYLTTWINATRQMTESCKWPRYAQKRCTIDIHLENKELHACSPPRNGSRPEIAQRPLAPFIRAFALRVKGGLDDAITTLQERLPFRRCT